ncbi:hypothetical protein [Moraxella bovoculi]|uniref:hypothetical protein n=1 Tax=Moraxella bovoculi TaxID=386891 RepID=UPI00062446CE|nr:hypothetical protein [Moraxella bovoculi]AKG17673.1 hypothetical protein AAX10_08505 [Moraxella bovoculi]ALT07579.1 hypothetical protein AAX08_08870 [Moraxella bovoculi]
MSLHNYSKYANDDAKNALENLLKSTEQPTQYRHNMTLLGELLGQVVAPIIKSNSLSLVVSTAEDADFLQRGIVSSLEKAHLNSKIAVFWNNHYQLSSGSSVAPIIYKYIDSDFQLANNIIVVKSVISGSCVVRTNLIEVLEQVKQVDKIFILSPVMHTDSEFKLKSEFPNNLADKFNFIYFATDAQRNDDGEVVPGIGGQIYKLLGIGDQPVLTGFIPQVVQQRIATL